MQIVREQALSMLRDLQDNQLSADKKQRTPKWYQRLYYEKGCVRDRFVSALVEISTGLKGDDKLKHVRMAKHELFRQFLIMPRSAVETQVVGQYLHSDLTRNEIALMYGVQLNSKCTMFYKSAVRGFKEHWILGGNGTADLRGTLVRGSEVPTWLPDLLEPSECEDWFEKIEEVWCG